MDRIPLSIRLLAVCAASTGTYANVPSPEDSAYFESEIRPILVDNCYKCHSAESEKLKGGFRIDSQPGVLRGGDSGPSITPGDASQSRLIQMVERHPDFEAMPPKSKINQSEIDALISWINRGAPDPRLEEPEGKTAEPEFNLEERKKWWSLQPVEKPAVPEVKQGNWPNNEYDHFILSKLEEKSWKPADPAERATLLRRLSFDLIGLAPTPQELETFLKDTSANTYAKQVDRLLSSPHYGEKWARHWMDIVRFAETKAFEADYTMAYAYRYRDYLIRAFNADIPFDQFVQESLAGDLIESPRFDPETGNNESIMGPGYIYLTDGQHGPPDVHEDEARIFDDMIDVTSKAFLGLTVACARCHDHKFDAITTADYYSFYGMLRSSRLSYANTVPQNLQQKVESQLKTKKKRLRSLVFDGSKEDADKVINYLAAQKRLLDDPKLQTALEELKANTSKKKNKNAPDPEDKLQAILEQFSAPFANEKNLDPNVLANWLRLAVSPEQQDRWPELKPLFRNSDRKEQKTKPKEALSQSFDAITQSLANWKTQGLAFEDSSHKPGDLILSAKGDQAVQGFIGNTRAAGRYSARVTGAIRSPDFIIDGKPIELQAKGQFGAVRLIVRNYELTGRGPTTAKLYAPINDNHWQTIHFETYLWEGQTAYLEVTQNAQATHSFKPKDTYPEFNDDAYISFRFENNSSADTYWNETPNGSDSAIASSIHDLWNKGRRGSLDDAESDLLSALFGAGLLQANVERSPRLKSALDQYRVLAQQIPTPIYTRSLVDGDTHDEPVYIQGSHNNLSQDPNPRHFLDGLDGPNLKGSGSGRLEWARYVATDENPLTARVLVNRLWKHLFSNGIVTTVDSFGKMGFAPSHSKLLDYLAADFTDNGWSIKFMIRKMVLSNAYQMSSTPSDFAQEADPKNRWLQHMPIKRLEAEYIRDHILACSESLDRTLYGPSVKAYVDDHPDSRAKPAEGPIDGDARRSVYLELRRNFLPTFLRAFDMPNTTEPTGARHVTNVPAQSLALMNDPFVHQQAKIWAKRILESNLSLEDKIDGIHLSALSRSATKQEKEWALRFLQALSGEYKTTIDDVTIWTDLCHMIYNRKEFIYVF